MKHIPSSLELGYTLIRVALGIVLVVSGYNKLTSGSEHLTQIGNAIGLFGITSGYLGWGYTAALTEFLTGIAYISGFLTRLASIPLIGFFIVAIKYHLNKGDSFSTWGFAFICLSITLGVLIAGSGDYSLDSYKKRYRHKHE